MIEEATGRRYARVACRKGIGEVGEMGWLTKDILEELKVWGHMGGTNGRVTMKRDRQTDEWKNNVPESA